MVFSVHGSAQNFILKTQSAQKILLLEGLDPLEKTDEDYWIWRGSTHYSKGENYPFWVMVRGKWESVTCHLSLVTCHLSPVTHHL